MAGTSESVADAVVAVITGLGLAPAPSIVKRKGALYLDGDPSALIVVSVWDGYQRQLLGRASATTRRFLVSYPAAVTLIQKNQGKTRENATLREWADQIDTAMLNWPAGLKVNGLPGVNEVEHRARALFDAPALGLGFDWTTLGYTVEVAIDA